MIPAALYLRISRDAEKRGLGVARQEQDTRAVADRKGWQVVAVFCDNDISATRKHGQVAYRPQYQEMIAAMRAGKVRGIVAYEVDRLGRDPHELEQFWLDAEQAGDVRVATSADDVDVDTGEGLMVARIKSAVAADEARKIQKRVQRKHLQLAEGGQLSGGGYRPFGYEPDRLTIRESEAKLIREAVDRVLQGASVRSVLTAWKAAGVSTVTGASWSPTTVKRLLMSGRISGQREHRGELVATAVWPAIITPEQTEQLRAVLTNPDRTTGGGVTPRSYLLSGLLVCAGCGSKMTARPVKRKGHTYRRYVCASDRGGCGRCGIGAQPLEDHVAAEILRLANDYGAELRRGGAVEAGDDGASKLAASVSADRLRLIRLEDALVDGDISKDAYRRRRAALEDGIAEAERKMAETAGSRAVFMLPRHEWAELTFDERRAVVERLFPEITVTPGSKKVNRFDPGRLTMECAWDFEGQMVEAFEDQVSPAEAEAMAAEDAAEREAWEAEG